MDDGAADLEAENLTDDAFLGGVLSILQRKGGYRAGIDAVLLAATVPEGPAPVARLLDLGAGVGTVGLCAARRIAGLHATLVEADPEAAELAERNSVRNRLADRVIVVTGDVTAAGSRLARVGLEADAFDAVVANPPYHTEGQGTPAAGPGKATAHAMPQPALGLWVRAMARHARPGGTATLIHKSSELANVLASMAGRFGALRVLPIQPRHGEPAIRVLVRGTKGSRAPLVLLPGFVLHDAGHGFTPDAERILKHGAPLPL